MSAAAKQSAPLTPVQQFYSTHSPADAIRLALADHAAHCDPMMPSSDFTKALHKALDRTEAYPKLVEALRKAIAADPSQAKGDGHLAPAATLLRELGEEA